MKCVEMKFTGIKRGNSEIHPVVSGSWEDGSEVTEMGR